MTTLSLTAVGGTRRKASIALAANVLFTVVLGSKGLERGFNDTTTKTKDQVKSGLLLDIVVRKSTAILKLLASENQTLLVWGNTLLILDLLLDIFDRVRAVIWCSGVLCVSLSYSRSVYIYIMDVYLTFPPRG